jgi:hypothetical protein
MRNISGARTPFLESRAQVRGTAFIAGGALPSAVRATERRGLMHSSDVYATLLGAAGVALPAGTDGVDQWVAIAAGSASPRSTVLISEGTFDDKGHGFAPAIIRGDMKLIAGETQVGFGRIFVSEIELPNMLANMVWRG